MPLTRSPTRNSNQPAVPNFQGGAAQTAGAEANKEEAFRDTQRRAHGPKGGMEGFESNGEEQISFFENWNAKGRRAASFTANMDLLAREIKAIADIIIPNTKLEIRKGVEKAMTIMKRMGKEIEEVVIMDKSYVRSYAMTEKESTRGGQQEKLEAVPTDLVINKDTGVEVVKEVIEKTWADDAFKKVKMTGGDPIGGEGENLVFWLGCDPGKNQALINIAKKAHRDVGEATKDGRAKEDFQIFETLSRTRGGAGSRAKLTLYFLVTGEELKDMISGLTRVRDEMVGDVGCMKKVNIAVAATVDIRTLRKVAELVFAQSDLEPTILVPPKSRLALVSRGKNQNETVGERNTGLLKINSGLSYSEMTKIVKEVVKPEDIGVEVKNLRKGKSESLVIVTKQKDGAKTLREEIMKRAGNRITDIRVEEGGKKEYMIVSDIDNTVTKEEVTEILLNELGNVERNEIEVKLQENRRGNMTVEIIMDRDKAKALLDKGKIKIGWTSCTVRRKVKVTRCYRCLKPGHSFFECRDKNNTGTKCFNCTQEGHKAENCVNTARCNMCKKEGHRADSSECPNFRRVLGGLTNRL